MLLQQAIVKCISLYCQETKISTIKQIKIMTNQSMIDLSNYLRNVIPCLDQYRFQIFEPNSDSFVDFDKICWKPYTLPINYLELSVIMIQYHRKKQQAKQNIVQAEDQQNSCSGCKSENKGFNEKKERSRERTIGEVIDLVRQWRLLQNKLVEGKRMNLKDTASLMGVSKKSLDDYYYQLRLGEFYCFNFAGNFHRKIGFLRAFIKQQEKKKVGKVPIRLPKKLNILYHSPQIQNNQSKQNTEKQCQIPENSSQDKQLSQLQQFKEPGFFWGNPFDAVSEGVPNNCEDNYFNQFKYQNPEDDPFIGLSLMKRQQSQQSNNSHLFF